MQARELFSDYLIIHTETFSVAEINESTDVGGVEMFIIHTCVSNTGQRNTILIQADADVRLSDDDASTFDALNDNGEWVRFNAFNPVNLHLRD